jgi:hypothetical protein
VLAVASAVAAPGARAESGESDGPRAVKTAPHPPQIRVIRATKHDKSRPLRDIPPVFPSTKRPHERENPVPRPRVGVSPLAEDPVLQTTAPTAAMPSPTSSFEGVGNFDGYVPPDTNGDVGPSNYVEIVNAAFAVYNKAGTKLYGPADINTVWNGFGGLCETTNSGDPVVQYDQLANRWLISQFAFDVAPPSFDPVGPYDECIAVSTSSDPTGSYYRYAFHTSDTELPDYPKLGVWPDAYYMSTNRFDETCDFCFVGAGAVAFDRAAMIQGLDASVVTFDLDTNFYSMLPADLDGSTTPASGASNPFVQFDDDAWGYLQDQLEIWNFHVDWTTPANSTFTSGGILTTAASNSDLCTASGCGVVQPGLGPSLDGITDRLMYRLAYRRLTGHEALVVNHTVNAGSARAGVRWYELRRTTGSWSIFQQGTYAPGDGNSRWMGSAAMDQSGDIAVGYSVSGSATNPAIRYAGRLVGDPAGQLTQGEATLQAGGGVQTGASRWGDYSSLDVDPSDGCTFWYANEYYPSTAASDWHTRIGSFKFPSCGPPPTISGFTPPSGGPGTSVTISGTNLNGATAVKFNGMSATFTVDSAIQITATVPAGATDGPISVVTPRGTAASAASFHIGPSVTSFTPASGAVGTVVTVNGTNLGSATTVTFGGVSAAPTSISETQVKAVVPVDAKTGKIGVTTPAGTGLSAGTFKVLPKLTSFSPASGPAGSHVTIEGSGFTDVSAPVKFGGVDSPSFAVMPTEITATVPAAAATGQISVTTVGGTATSATAFKVVPTITGFSPGTAAVGGTVTVDGTGFGGVSSVKVNGVGAAFTVLSPLQLRLTVPAGAGTGAIAVTTAGGTATSGSTLFVLPRVTSFTPSSAAVGATVTVYGNAFGGATSVLFGGVLAAPVTVTATTIKVLVPADAVTGKLTVVTPAGSGQSVGTFKVLPKLTSFSPPSGAAGASVTIAGSGFTDVSAVKVNGVLASSFTIDSSIQITATVPPAATTGRLSVVTAGGTATSLTNFLAVPTITGFAPGSAAAGTPVVVDGTGFGGVSSVKVNGVTAGYTVLSPTQLRFTVPAGGSTGPISVTTAGGTATSGSTFFVLPRVTSFTPSTAAVGATLTVYGNAFGGATSVLFNGVVAAPATVAPGKITVVVPADASTGKLTVVTSSGSGQSVGTFKVLPKLTSFSPASGAAGASVVVAGSGFTDVTAVKLNGVAAGFSVDSNHQITATVPATATTGKLSVVTAGGTATSATNFLAVPTITGFAPGSAAAGAPVTVDGTGFGGVSSVKVNGVAASFTVLSPVQLRLTVPAAASTGAISLTTAGGTATSGSTLLVLPRVTYFTPSTAGVGATVTVYGNAFGGATSVLFGGVLASPATVTATKITVPVPADAVTGKLTVVTPSGSGQSVGTFKVLPKLTSFAPASGPVGTSVGISGSGFTSVSAVKFNGHAATTFTVDTSGHITATVPVGATTGRVSVVTAGGTAASATNYTVTP